MEPMRRLRKPRTMRHTAENHARSLAKLSELGAEVWSDVMEYGMPYCIRLLQARHLSAEAVAAIGDLHVVGAVRRGLHQHRHLQGGVADGVDDAALLAEVRQRDDDAVDLVAMLAEELGATARFIGCFYGAELRLLRRERDDAYAGLFEHTDHRLSTFLGEVIGKETTISNNQCKR